MAKQLTSRELSYLEDSLQQEVLMVKKFITYAEQCQDPDLKQACLKVADKHAHHFDMLLEYLND